MILYANSAEAQTVQVTDLFEKYHAELFAYLCRLVNDREWAQDLTQEAFLNAFRARGRLAEIENPRAWLYRIATNLALNALKRRRRFAWLPWHAAPQAQVNKGNVYEEVSVRSAVEEALRALPLDYRAPLLLYAHSGLSVAEIAQALGISQGAVKTRLFRARELFRRAFEGGQN